MDSLSLSLKSQYWILSKNINKKIITCSEFRGTLPTCIIFIYYTKTSRKNCWCGYSSVCSLAWRNEATIICSDKTDGGGREDHSSFLLHTVINQPPLPLSTHSPTTIFFMLLTPCPWTQLPEIPSVADVKWWAVVITKILISKSIKQVSQEHVAL